jgi:hypothetical protein
MEWLVEVQRMRAPDAVVQATEGHLHCLREKLRALHPQAFERGADTLLKDILASAHKTPATRAPSLSQERISSTPPTVETVPTTVARASPSQAFSPAPVHVETPLVKRGLSFDTASPASTTPAKAGVPPMGGAARAAATLPAGR